MSKGRGSTGNIGGFLEELGWRRLLHDQTPGLAARLQQGPITGYVGFDPTARSLQVGNLVPVMLLAHLQRAGGKPIVVVGGGTGMIGDPSGKRSERPLLEAAEVEANVARQRAQLERFLRFGPGASDAEVVDNAEWLRSLNLIAFLRDIGKHFTLSFMLQKESVKGRMEAGISYTEFSYMLLQAYDFLHLYQARRCELQMGGSDQWGNITAGIELIRRTTGGEAHGLAAPLLATASGAKFGKTEAGLACWLDPELTSPYRFYQFWINVADDDVEAWLRTFTFMERGEIASLMAQHHRDPGARVPHRALARDVTTRVHGVQQSTRASEAAGLLFGHTDLAGASPEAWELLAHELQARPPKVTAADLPRPALDLIYDEGWHTSKSELRRLFQQGGISINRQRMQADTLVGPDQLLCGRYLLVRRGKTTYGIIRLKVS
jgi:tyrosyl-tRNA synthetase